MIFDERPTQLLNTKLLLLLNVTIFFQELLLFVVQNLNFINLPNETLKNDGRDRFNHSYIPKSSSQANTNSFLTSLTSTLDLTSYLNHDLTPVLDTSLVYNIQNCIFIKLFPRFKYMA